VEEKVKGVSTIESQITITAETKNEKRFQPIVIYC